MKSFLLVLASIALTGLCWGVYGPLMRWGGQAMHGSHLMPFMCVGAAYMLIAVIAPIALLRLRGEQGAWTMTGTVWSVAAGAAGAVGALGVILAFTHHGNPIYVMPLVFGGAPVVNTFVSMYMTKTYSEAGPVFYAGLILVITGAAAVLYFNPAAKATGEAISYGDFIKVLCFAALTAVCWGGYGPVLHKGQMAMKGSRLRPFMCVGLAYFLVAVMVPAVLILAGQDHGEFTASGASWSLAGGAAGALGALGIILAFTFGGKPVMVMPLVFGIAPVVNTLVSIVTAKNLGDVQVMFYAGLLIVVAGAATVLIFAPKAHPAPSAKQSPRPA